MLAGQHVSVLRPGRWYDAYPTVRFAVTLMQLSPQLCAGAEAPSSSSYARRHGDRAWMDGLAALQHYPEANRFRAAEHWAQGVLGQLSFVVP